MVAVDLATKLGIESAFTLHESKTVIPGLFNIVYIKNKGAAFGFLSQINGDWVSYAFMAIAVTALVVIALLYRSAPADDWISRAAYVLIGSGALGNLIDRIRSGAVTDFLLFYIGEYQWPAFNVADSCITVGIILLGYVMAFNNSKPGSMPVDRV